VAQRDRQKTMTSKLAAGGLASLLTLFGLVVEKARATTVYTYKGNFFKTREVLT